MSVTVIVGEQRGDEGKGRYVDMLAEEHDIVARFNGGNNAGHTFVVDGQELNTHSIPSGIAHADTMNIIGRGCLLNAGTVGQEMDNIRSIGIDVSPDNLLISSSSHLILPHHIVMDAKREKGTKKQGITKSGIAPTASDKYIREGLRAEIINNDLLGLHKAIVEGLASQQGLWEKIRERLHLTAMTRTDIAEEYVEKARELAPFITDTDIYMNQRLTAPVPASVAAEGAQAFWLDIDHGMWPYVTSSSTTVGGVTNGLGIPPRHITKVIGVSKLIPSHVGDGPFITEIDDMELATRLRGEKGAVDSEFGKSTGRARKLGKFDLPSLRRSQMVNGTAEMAVTKLDSVPLNGETVDICVSHERKGKTHRIAADATYKLEQSTPVYETLPTWKEDITGIRNFEDLPAEAQNYIQFIETQTGVPITMIGVGPEREQVIDRRAR